MQHCIATLRTKEVINKKDGCRLGHVCDVEIDACDGRIINLVLCRGGRLLTPYACESDLRIPWCDVEVIGDDIIIVCFSPPAAPPRGCSRRSFFR